MWDYIILAGLFALLVIVVIIKINYEERDRKEEIKAIVRSYRKDMDNRRTVTLRNFTDKT